MTARFRKHLTAWLGLIAMWLIVLAPVVSQLVVAARSADPTAPVLCSAMPSAADSGHHAHGDPLVACGYCDLLADHVVIPTLHPTPLVLVTLVMIVAAPVLSTRFIPRGTFSSSPPRAPPAFHRVNR